MIRQTLQGVRRRASSFRLAVTQRLRHSWTTWRLNRTYKRIPREMQRAQLLRAELHRQLLLVKELEQVRVMLQHRLAELPEPTEPEPELPPMPPAEEQLTELLRVETPQPRLQPRLLPEPLQEEPPMELYRPLGSEPVRLLITPPTGER